MIINRIYENQNLLSLQLVSFLVGLRTYQHPVPSHGVLAQYRSLTFQMLVTYFYYKSSSGPTDCQQPTIYPF